QVAVPHLLRGALRGVVRRAALHVRLHHVSTRRRHLGHASLCVKVGMLWSAWRGADVSMPDLPPSLRPLSDYARERQSMTREQFLAAHATPVLIVPVVAPLQDDEHFSTRKVPTASAMPAAEVAPPPPPPPAWAAVKVQKRAGDAFPNFIWVG